MGEVLVSISCITFNQVSFIKKCLDGFLMQKTNFEFEVLIHDDASTDGTIEIIREYEKKYPKNIKPIIQEENQFSQGKRGFNAKYNFSRAQGKYIALCEGDDYWTDPFKLQKQVEILEGTPSLSACFTNALIKNEINESETMFVNALKEGIVPSKKIVLKGGGIYPTASLMARTKHLDDNMLSTVKNIAGDGLLIYTLLSKGEIYYLDQITCVYRRWSGGVYSNISNDIEKIVLKNKKELRDYDIIDRLMGFKYHKYFSRRISNICVNIVSHSNIFYSYRYLRRIHFRDYIKLIYRKIKLLIN